MVLVVAKGAISPDGSSRGGRWRGLSSGVLLLIVVLVVVAKYYELEQARQKVAANPGSKVEWVGSGLNQHPVIKYPSKNDNPSFSNRVPDQSGTARPSDNPRSLLDRYILKPKQRQESQDDPQRSPQIQPGHLVWKFDSDCYLEIQHVSKLKTTTTDGSNDDPPLSIRFLFRLIPQQAGPTGTQLQVSVLACDSSSTSADKADDDQWKKMMDAYKNQLFVIKLSPGNQEMTITHTEDLLKRWHANLGADQAELTKAELDATDEMLLLILRTHLEQAFMPVPEKQLAPREMWTHSTTNNILVFTTTTKRTYSLAPPNNTVKPGHEVITWKGSMESMKLRDESIGPQIKLDGKILLDEGIVVWDKFTGKPARIDSIVVSELDMAGEVNGQKKTGNVISLEASMIRFHTNNPDKP